MRVDVREQIHTLIEARSVDLKDAAHIRPIVGMVIELDTIDLDRAIVPRRIRARRPRAAEARGEGHPLTAPSTPISTSMPDWVRRTRHSSSIATSCHR